MHNTKSIQKKSSMASYIYAAVIALLVAACAITIAVVNARNTSNANVGEDTVMVAANTFVVPVKNATIAKDYSGT